VRTSRDDHGHGRADDRSDAQRRVQQADARVSGPQDLEREHHDHHLDDAELERGQADHAAEEPRPRVVPGRSDALSDFAGERMSRGMGDFLRRSDGMSTLPSEGDLRAFMKLRIGVMDRSNRVPFLPDA
jgi:hypothetical protein